MIVPGQASLRKILCPATADGGNLAGMRGNSGSLACARFHASTAVLRPEALEILSTPRIV